MGYSIIKKEIEDIMTYIIGKVNLNLVQEILNSIIWLDITKEKIKYQIDNKLENYDDSIHISDDNILSTM